jgi:hypothetical protein
MNQLDEIKRIRDRWIGGFISANHAMADINLVLSNSKFMIVETVQLTASETGVVNSKQNG